MVRDSGARDDAPIESRLGHASTSAVARTASLPGRLNRHVSDLLDMTPIEGGIVEIRPVEVDLNEAIAASVERLHRQSSGLGLPIVRGLVEVQGGRVWLEDGDSAHGACFAFSLPPAERGASDAEP